MNHGKAGLRGKVGGWTAASSRRNMRFLWSVATDDLTGDGYSFTLTVRDCPANPKEWAEWCAVYFKRLFARGAIRLHWVIEWQRRGCPHLHGSVYFPRRDFFDSEGVDLAKVLTCWLDNNPFGAALQSQRALPIYDALGWAQYVAKHAARGVRHYQRSPENIPQAWKGATGRMWGYRGSWPLSEPLRIDLQDKLGDGGWYAFRRLVRSYAVAQARLKPDGAGYAFARSILKANTRELGEVRGIASWVPMSIVEQLMGNLDDRGFAVSFRAKVASDTGVGR